ncbi:MAG: GNAT family protein [Flavobacteriaceae bacterium]
MISLQTDNILLRALEPNDLDFLFQTENDTSLWQVSQTIAPFSKHILSQYLANAHQDIYEAKQLRLVIEHNSTPIGMIDLFDFDPQHKRASVGIFVLEKFQQKGFANNALELLITYAFSTLNLHQLYANIASDNKRSHHLFTKNGFVKIGLKKDWVFYNNTFKDEILYQLINTN